MEIKEIISTAIAGIVVIVGIICLIYVGTKYYGKELEQRSKLIEVKERQTIALEKIAEYYRNLHI